MKKRARSLCLVVAMSFTLFYPELALNDNVLECVSKENGEIIVFDGREISLTDILRAPKGDKVYRFKLLEWISELCESLER